ncbi:MAG: GGDEF domain-containing protein [Pseudomonadota bacterium]
MDQSPDDHKKDYTLFAQEEEVITQARDMVAKLEQVAGGVRSLADAYGRQFHEQRKMLRMSDRIQLELHRANQRLAEQAEELKTLNAALKAEIEQRKTLEEKLRDLATTDSLTGLFTRRRFFELGLTELHRKARNDLPLSLMLLDLDHFKRINDRHGHAVGDEVLVGMARVGRDNLRDVDVFGRLGGEEFGVILPGADLNMARRIAERFREALARWNIPKDGDVVSVTVSIGLTEIGSQETALENPLSRADKALYYAKRLGRNRAAAWEELPPDA